MTVVVWDFDGVLNRNFIDEKYVWADGFEQDIGHSHQFFANYVFADGFAEILTGREDLRDRVQGWADQVACKCDADQILAYWFDHDVRPDAHTIGLMEALNRRGVRQVIATNNEPRRTAYIEHQMGFGARVEHIFASGRMGLAKPDPAFFDAVTDQLRTQPSDMLLIDDHPQNVAAAEALGWRVFHFTPQSASDLAAHLPL